MQTRSDSSMVAGSYGSLAPSARASARGRGHVHGHEHSHEADAEQEEEEPLLQSSPAACPDDDDKHHGFSAVRQASVLSRMFFLWFQPLVEIASHRRITATDIWNLPSRFHSEHAYNEFNALYRVNRSLSRTILICYRHEIALGGLLALIAVIVSSAMPVLLYQVVRLTKEEADHRDVGLIAVLLGCTVVTHIVFTMLEHHSARVMLLVATRTSSAIHTLVFECAITSRPRFMASKSVFMLHNIGKLYHFLSLAHSPWYAALRIIANLLVLNIVIGDMSYITVIAAVVAQLGVVVFIFANEARLKKWIFVRAKRVQFVADCIKTIQSIKLNALEDRSLERIQEVRAEELKLNASHLSLEVCLRSVIAILPEFVIACTFAALVWSGIDADRFGPAQAITTVAIIHQLQATISTFITTLRNGGRAFKVVQKLERYLSKHSLEQAKAEEAKSANHLAATCTQPLITHPAVMLHVANAIVAQTLEEPLILNANLLVRRGELVVIYGKTGSGKSSLLGTLMGDSLQLNRRGNVDIKGRLAYCSQDPWLQTESIRDNIVFGQPFDEDKYLNVLHACCLLRDLAAFPGGDQTIIGPKGLNISGGQKARICLARACYSDADVFLLDSPLASVDAIVQSDIFSRCLLELLKFKTIVLVTHNMEVVSSPFVDQVARVEDHQLVPESELGRTFSIDPQLSYRPLRSIEQRVGPGDRPSRDIAMRSPEESGLQLLPLKESKAGVMWRKITAKSDRYKTSSELDSVFQIATVPQYIEMCGSRWFYPPILLTMVLSRVAFVSSDLWFFTWSAKSVSRSEDPGRNTTQDVFVYAALVTCAGFITFCGSKLTAWGCRRAANVLFTRMARGVIQAPMSFFYSRPIGEIMNRFSSDVIHLDWRMQELISKHSSAVADIVVLWVILGYFIPEMFIIVPLFVHWMTSSQDQFLLALELMRHNSASQSPCYNAIDESVEGRRIIQAFGDAYVTHVRVMFQRNLDNMFKMNFTMAMFRSWGVFQFFKVDILLISVVVFVALRRALDPVTLGIALIYIFAMNSRLLEWTGSAIEICSTMLNVDRIFEYANTPSDGSEGGQQNHIQSENNAMWPSRGEIVFQNVCFQYNSTDGLALKNVSLHVGAGEKVAVVGRTGAGKSSLTMALFRIHDLISGRILIDGMDISRVEVHVLRSRLSIIPQTPLFLRGTLRGYLDPYDEEEDVHIWNALRKTGLADTVSRMAEKLNAPVEQDAANLSQGERQLLCLSRAMLKRSAVVVLDEATAAVDQQSDEMLQHVLKMEFASSTLISIAHRLESILAFDRIVVMDDGSVVQSGTVEDLVADANGPFFDLLEGALLKM